MKDTGVSNWFRVLQTRLKKLGRVGGDLIVAVNGEPPMPPMASYAERCLECEARGPAEGP